MADVTISELTPGAPADNNIIPYSTGTDTLGVPVSAMFQNTSVIKTNTLGGLNGLQLYTNKLTRKSFWFIEKTMATTGPGAGPNAGDWTSLGYITPPEFGTGWGREIKIFATHHIPDSVNSVTYQLHDSYRTRSLTYADWVKVPSVSNYNYSAKQDFSLEARRTRTTNSYSNLELRYRAIDPSAAASTYGGNVAFAIEILGGGEFFETTGGGNDLTVPAGYLGNTFYQFPLRTYADDTHTSFEPSTRGLFMVQPGRVGINTIAPAATLDVNGVITTNTALLFDRTEKTANIMSAGGPAGASGIANFNVLVQPGVWTTIATTSWGGQVQAAFVTEPNTTYNLQGFHIVPCSYGASNNARLPSYTDSFVNAGGWTQYNIQWRSTGYNLQVYHTGPVPIRFWGTFSGV